MKGGAGGGRGEGGGAQALAGDAGAPAGGRRGPARRPRGAQGDGRGRPKSRLPDGPRKAYLSPVADLFDGKPVAWPISPSPDAGLANSSLLAACATLRPGERPAVHADGGCHYRWPGWKAICEGRGLTRSMSRKGCPPDNAACEGFFGNLKREMFIGRDWRGVSYEEFAAALDRWMRRYSTERLKAFREGGRTVYDTIDGRRSRLGLPV